MAFIDRFLNSITMYRLVLYYLIALLVLAAVLGLFGVIPVNPANLAFSTLLILAVSSAVNAAFARSFRAPANIESVYITALILALIISPVAYTDYAGVGFVIFAAAWAMASKFILAVHKKHLFNPAAFGVAFAALALNQGATWWAGSYLPLFPFMFIGGVLIARKIHRLDLACSFIAVALLTIVVTATNGHIGTALSFTLLHSPLFFLAFVMLTEPLTMPPTRPGRLFYGAIVGFLFAPNIHLGSIVFTPELALLVGNLFTYFISPEGRFNLTLVEKNKLADGTYEFVFLPDLLFDFRPGQYLEWTLAPQHVSDNRGNRRYFTIASSPTEKEVRLGVKFYEPKSGFKRALDALKVHDTISASQLAGDFVLPKNPNKKLAFIAGGIGITPFRSMAQYLVDTKDTRQVTLLYLNKMASDIAYKEVFDEAERAIGMKTVYALTGEPAPVPGTHHGKIDAALIAKEIPDYKECAFYISGPHRMVDAFTNILRGMGVSRFSIKTDYFPGFA